MKNYILILIIVISVSGCTATRYISAGVAAYCSTPQTTRVALRESVALAIAPNAIKIDCYADEG